MTAEDMAAIARAAYRHATPWSAAAFADALAAPGAVLATDPRGAFVLARVIVDDCEILSVATAPGLQGQGLASALMRAALADAVDSGATRAILEVADDNAPARALYARLGFAPVGRRRGYYPRPGQAADALILARALP